MDECNIEFTGRTTYLLFTDCVAIIHICIFNPL